MSDSRHPRAGRGIRTWRPRRFRALALVCLTVGCGGLDGGLVLLGLDAPAAQARSKNRSQDNDRDSGNSSSRGSNDNNDRSSNGDRASNSDRGSNNDRSSGGNDQSSSSSSSSSSSRQSNDDSSDRGARDTSSSSAAGSSSGSSANRNDDRNSGGGGSAGRSGTGKATDSPPASVADAWQRFQDWLQANPADAAREGKDASWQTRTEHAPGRDSGRNSASGSADARGKASDNGKTDSIRETGSVSHGKSAGEGSSGKRGSAVADAEVPRNRGAGAAKSPAAGTSIDKPARTATQRADSAPPPRDTFVRSEIVAAKIKPDQMQRLEDRGFKVKSVTPSGLLGSTVTLTPPPGMDEASALDALRQEAPAAASSYNHVYRPFKTQAGVAQSGPRGVVPAGVGGCDPARCFGTSLIKWQPDLPGCARGLAVGMLDTGVDHAHPAFARGKLKVGDFHRDGAAPAPPVHGTGVLSILAGAPESGTPGLIPDSQFYVADVFYAGEDGAPATDTVSLVRALDWMDKFDVRVINLSLAGPRDEVIETQIQALTAKGVVILAAAGNEGPTAPPSYPAAYKDVIAVTAVDRDQRSYRYANRGSYIDIAAPGVDIWTAVPGARAGLQTGTSFAVPFVTAAVAILYNASPRKTKAAIIEQLPTLDLGQPGRDPIYGRGLMLAPTSCRPPAKPAGEQLPEMVSDPVAPERLADKPRPVFSPASSTAPSGFGFSPSAGRR